MKRKTLIIQRKPHEKVFEGNAGANCLLASSTDGKPRLIIYHLNRIVYTQRFEDELNARRFAVEFKPPKPPTKRHREKMKV